MLRLYFIGITILIVAILANSIIIKIGIKSWYDFIELLSKNGTSTFKSIGVMDALWLFFGYPMVLGFGYWLGNKLYSLII